MLASRNSSQNQQIKVALASEGKQWLTPAALSQACKRARFHWTAFQRHTQDLTKSYSKDRKSIISDVSNLKTCLFLLHQTVKAFAVKPGIKNPMNSLLFSYIAGWGKLLSLFRRGSCRRQAQGCLGQKEQYCQNQQHKHQNSFSISCPASWQSSCPSATAQGKVSHRRSNWNRDEHWDRFPRRASLAEQLEPDLLPLYYKNMKTYSLLNSTCKWFQGDWERGTLNNRTWLEGLDLI